MFSSLSFIHSAAGGGVDDPAADVARCVDGGDTSGSRHRRQTSAFAYPRLVRGNSTMPVPSAGLRRLAARMRLGVTLHRRSQFRRSVLAFDARKGGRHFHTSSQRIERNHPGLYFPSPKRNRRWLANQIVLPDVLNSTQLKSGFRFHSSRFDLHEITRDLPRSFGNRVNALFLYSNYAPNFRPKMFVCNVENSSSSVHRKIQHSPRPTDLI